MLITQADIEARLGRVLTSNEQTTFDLVNQANQAYAEEIIGSSVEEVSESTRYFDGGKQHLVIDPCTDISSVKLVDDDNDVSYTYLSRDYTQEPINNTLKTMLRHRSAGFMTGINNIQVNAKFSIYGDTNMLRIVKNALLESLEAEINNTDNIKRQSIEGYSVEYATTTTKDAFKQIRGIFPYIL